MKYFLVSFMAMLIMSLTPQVSYADDIMIFEDGNRTLISGTVVKARGDYITLENNGQNISVDLDKVDLEGRQKAMIKEGMRVLVGGNIKNNGRTLRARTIMFLTSQSMEDRIISQLIAENVFDRN